MTKTKQPKPVKAWALIDKESGEIVSVPYGVHVYRTREIARNEVASYERVVRVEIKALK